MLVIPFWKWYTSHVESILMFNITAWCGNLGVRKNNKLQRIVRMAGKNKKPANTA